MIKKILILKCFMLLIPMVLWAKEYEAGARKIVNDSIPVDFYFSDFDINLDNLMRLWRVQETIASDTLAAEIAVDELSFVIEHHDSIYIQRLERIPSLVNLTYNNVVRSSIHVYTNRRRNQMDIMLGLSEYYFPIFDEIFDFYEMPLEFRYLAVVESALNPVARSRAGATGIWQFMLATGRMYGLQVTTFVDQRRDPVAATHAAARYLRDLYNMYDDWTLAMAAYNCGPGNVNRAIRRAGGKTCYWEIYPYLPRETRGYVPLYIGATYAMHYYKEHGFTPRQINVPPDSDTIMVNRNVNLSQVSQVMGIPLQLLRDLNPQYLRDIIPGNSAPHPLRLPILYTAGYIDLEESIVNHRPEVFLSNSFRPVSPAGASSSSSSAANSSVNTAGRDRMVHTIRSGETLSTIASRYGVTVRNLQAWNNLSGTRIVAGRQLVVYVAPRQSSSTAAAPSSQASTATATTASAGSSSGGNVTYYTVKQGDTVWAISQMYSGVSVNDIQRWNNLSANSRITPGMRLRIMQ